MSSNGVRDRRSNVHLVKSGLAGDPKTLLSGRINGDFYDRSPFHRGRLERARIDKGSIRHPFDLRRLPPMILGDVPTVATLLLASGEDPSGPQRMAHRHWPRYWPLRWTQVPIPLAYSADDLHQLARNGADLLHSAGIGRRDVVVDITDPTAVREQLQLELGAGKAGISLARYAPTAPLKVAMQLLPTVLCGDAHQLCRLLKDATESGSVAFQHLHTLLVVGAPPLPREEQLLNAFLDRGSRAVIRMWAPEGVLSAWAQCRKGSGFHIDTAIELVELVDPVSGLPVPEGQVGRILWTGVGWYATALLRLQVEGFGRLQTGECSTCGRSTPRIEPVDECEGFPAVLDAHPGILAWYAELERTIAGDDELTIWLAPAAGVDTLMLLQEIDVRIGSATVHQVSDTEVERRISDAKGERFGDRRAIAADR